MRHRALPLLPGGTRRPGSSLVAAAVLAGAVSLAQAPAAAAVAPGATVVTLGDSYASGEGNPDFTADEFGDSAQDGCHRSAASGHATFGRAIALATGGDHVNAACSGATTTDVLTGKNGEPGQLSALGPATRLVTISAGGNDVGFEPILTACFVVGGTPWRCDARLDEAHRALDDLVRPQPLLGGVSRLEFLYRSVQAAAPGAQLVVTGYPYLFPAEFALTCATSYPAVRTRLRPLTDEVNQALAATAARVGATFVDLAQPFTGHSACEPAVDQRWLHHVVPWPSERMYSFHPNAQGQVAISQALWAAHSAQAQPTTTGR